MQWLSLWITVGIVCFALCAEIGEWRERAHFRPTTGIVAVVILGTVFGFFSVIFLIAAILVRVFGSESNDGH